jgi:hypothetical protein
MRDLFLLSYCAAIGFVAAGVAASFYKMMTHEPARFALLGQGWAGALATFLFCAVSGPAIMLDLVVKLRFTDRRALGALFGGLAIVLLWSVCSGILVLQLVLQIRSGLA